MEPAHLGVILDSSIVIEAERQRLDVARFLKHVAERIGERETALCSISVAELAHGIHRANTPERRQARRAFLDDLKAAVVIYPITADTAELAGKIHADSSQQGITVPFDDLLIGACAMERGYAIVTRNERHFQKSVKISRESRNSDTFMSLSVLFSTRG
jgi:predicted nucleic acid-binding protein